MNLEIYKQTWPIEEISKVSIVCNFYNHEKYTKEAIESFLNQRTSFKVEILLHDDASSDSTASIIKEFETKYPSLIKAIYQKQNQGLQGINNWISHQFPRAKGKYIALCDGDDYWTDENKLQKQVDFLEANSDCSISFHRANLLTAFGLALHEVPSPYETIAFYYVELLRHYNFIATASVMFKRPENFIVPEWYTLLPFGDLALYKIISQDKKIACINEIMSVYRIHENGMWSGLSSLEAENRYLDFYKKIYFHLNNTEKGIVSNKIKNCLKQVAKLKFGKSTILMQFYYRLSLIKYIKYL